MYEDDKGYIAGNQTVQIIGISALSPLRPLHKRKITYQRIRKIYG